MWAGFSTALFSRPDSRSACLPVLAITVHVFIVFASLEGGKLLGFRTTFKYNYESTIHDGHEEYGNISVLRLYRSDQFLELVRGQI
jgi:hypothetical protein